jgi:hypothetical protein
MTILLNHQKQRKRAVFLRRSEMNVKMSRFDKTVLIIYPALVCFFLSLIYAGMILRWIGIWQRAANAY